MYQLWHQYELVLEVQGESIKVHAPDKLPFDLRHEPVVKYSHWLEWLKRRISTISRTYMNQLYKQRRLGRGHVEVINDSAAVSVVDMFWVSTPELSHTWDNLQVLRDENLATVKASLEGVIDKEEMLSILQKGPQDTTSVLTVKGAFPKSIYKGHLLKKGDNAEYEVSAYKLGYKLGFDVAKAETYQDGAVACTLFTDERTSMVHALEMLYPFNPPTTRDIYVKALEKYAGTALEKQLQRLFMFNYLVCNFDFHGENFGFLYSPESFELLGVAPAYDFNSAFDAYGDITAYDSDIFTRLPQFINNNLDLIPNLKRTAEYLATDPYLNQEQKNEVVSRADYLIALTQHA